MKMKGGKIQLTLLLYLPSDHILNFEHFDIKITLRRGKEEMFIAEHLFVVLTAILVPEDQMFNDLQRLISPSL